ncbi:reductase [Limosilactobacillus coleohominis]|jgi:riboflavin biosynthesis RibT protein|uniref:Reductase n=1 Tax=Limosilactobacillus coleohominis TaxID=181675 RepID=A0ABS2GX37_9LACO|nr:reductase [Limosilactobacillus coleohominis]MCI5813241.1 reductase [Lactobacillus sp.]HJA24106.1 reductase [Candidatus Limosilactobacillus intestinavium]MBM6939919.1 reductase [Limosilactobacillus coleohominis]MBM6954129.1 reductase [Limosilactobacillus coleohominis]MDY3702683.1 reductase [Limosilactobacillus coleohominis]
MLVNYRKDYQKIVMGLLSFIPDLDEYDRLDEEIEWGTEPPRRIVLWKNTKIDQFGGVAIIESGADYILIRRMSFTPSERSGRNMYLFLSAIAEQESDKRVIGTLKTQSLVTNWRHSNQYDN